MNHFPEIFSSEQYYYLRDTYVQKDEYYKKQEKITGKQSEISEKLAVTQEKLSSQKNTVNQIATLVMFGLSAVLGIYNLLARK